MPSARSRCRTGQFAEFHRDHVRPLLRRSRKTLLDSDLVLPALDYCLKCSHLFNVLDASGSIGVTERTAYILRVRQLAVAIAQALASVQPRRPRRVLSQEAAMDRELLLEIGVEEMPASWLPGLTAQLAERLKARLIEEGLPSKTTVEVHRDAAPADRVPAGAGRSPGRPRRDGHGPAGVRRVRRGRASDERGPGICAQARRGLRRDRSSTDTPKGKYLSYLKHIRGKATVDVLPAVLGKVLRDLTVPQAR